VPEETASSAARSTVTFKSQYGWGILIGAPASRAAQISYHGFGLFSSRKKHWAKMTAAYETATAGR